MDNTVKRRNLFAMIGPAVKWIFMPYMLVWSLSVGVALMSVVGMVLVGGFKLFHKVMSVCIVVMFAVVVVTACALRPSVTALLSGIFIPRIPGGAENVGWTVGLMGGVGGTLTVLCYGYWMRESSRAGKDSLRTCRIDLVIA